MINSIFQFLTYNILISWSTPSSHYNFGRPTLLNPSIPPNTKILMYKAHIRPAPTHASETWALSEREERPLSLFERKALRSVFGAKQEKETWRKRYNSELHEAFNEPNTVHCIKVNRLAWAGHLMRMNNDRTLKIPVCYKRNRHFQCCIETKLLPI